MIPLKSNWYLITGILIACIGIIGVYSSLVECNPDLIASFNSKIDDILASRNYSSEIVQFGSRFSLNIQSGFDGMVEVIKTSLGENDAVNKIWMQITGMNEKFQPEVKKIKSGLLESYSNLTQRNPLGETEGLSTPEPRETPLPVMDPFAPGANLTEMGEQKDNHGDSFIIYDIEKTPQPNTPVKPEIVKFHEKQVTKEKEVRFMPDRIVIPEIELDAPVIPVISIRTGSEGDLFTQWRAPDKFAAGWHLESAPLGKPGNTVINGHHNVFGKVFANLVKLEEGDIVNLFSGDRQFDYVIVNKMILPERDVSLEQKVENGRWISPSDDERLTLITCWPAWTNTHRLILVASPIQ